MTSTRPVSARAQVRAAGHKRYRGKVCRRHKNLRGERLTINALCVRCFYTKKRSRPSSQKYQYANHRTAVFRKKTRDKARDARRRHTATVEFSL
jgi:hypothetical protein